MADSYAVIAQQLREPTHTRPGHGREQSDDQCYPLPPAWSRRRTCCRDRPRQHGRGRPDGGACYPAGLAGKSFMSRRHSLQNSLVGCLAYRRTPRQ
jgi:hypothetical protein